MSTGSAYPLDDDFVSSFEEWKNGPSKTTAIVRSSAAIVTTALSLLLIWIIMGSRDHWRTTYHRLLLGMSSSDILISCGQTTFGALAPRELGYFVWNAHGNQSMCTAVGFAAVLGGSMTLLYNCSLNLYHLALVRYGTTPAYIETRVEPWLHAVPIIYGLAMGVAGVAMGALNPDLYGECFIGGYDPLHCEGYDDGEVPAGFEIPCGQGHDTKHLYMVLCLAILFIAPITIGSSLLMIYRSVRAQERRVAQAQHIVAAIELGNARGTSDDAPPAADAEGEGEGEGGARPWKWYLLNRLRGCGRNGASQTSSNQQDLTRSRLVLHRVAAFSLSYFVTWIWFIMYLIINLAGKWPTEFPPPQVVVYFYYVANFFNPIQGLWTFLIYMHPKVVSARASSSERDRSWFKAFSTALYKAVSGEDDAHSPLS